MDKNIDTSKIEFIAVSLDEKIETWKNSKNEKKIIWTSVWQPNNLYGYLCLQYNLTSIPYFILFDNQKKVYSIKEGANELKSIKEALEEQKLLLVK